MLYTIVAVVMLILWLLGLDYFKHYGRFHSHSLGDRYRGCFA